MEKMKALRVRAIATVTSLASQNFASLRCAALVLAILCAASSASPVCAFSPGPASNTAGGPAAAAVAGSAGSRVEGRAHEVNSRRRYLLPRLFASEDDDVNGSMANMNDSNDIEDEEHDVDIITQKLSRNAESGPINPIKEHDKMRQENEHEAISNANSVINGSGDNSTQSLLYSQMLANAVNDPDFDPDSSADEQFVETQLRELLSRKGKELSMLGPGIATLPLDPSSPEAKAEEKISEKESALQEVIAEATVVSTEKWDESNLEESQKKQSEILERAGRLQAEIDQLHIDDCGAVLLANLAFYEAFSLQDAEGMRNVWWQSPSVMCIHPSHPALIGSNAVYSSFAAIFENGIKGRGGAGSSPGSAIGGVFMTPTNIRGLSVRGTSASLVCDEEVYSKETGTNGARRQLVNKLQTTNIFRKIGGQWKMAHRHASWHPGTTAAQSAMNAKPGFATHDERLELNSNSMSKKKNDGITLRKLNSGDGGVSRRPKGSPPIPSSLEGLDASAVLGIPIPKEEKPAKSPSSSEGGMIGKIINLSDFLGGGDASSDAGDSEDSGIGDMLADLLKGSAESDITKTSGSGTPEDPFITRRIIKIGPDDIDNLLSKKGESEKKSDDQGDAGDKEVVIDLRDKSEEERKTILSQLADGAITDADIFPGEGNKAFVDEEGELRQQCIATLRKLAENGQISPKQKRVLLTDIITSSAKGEMSMVEVAYELLCTGDQGEPRNEAGVGTGMEDFTEQCRVFASMGDDDC